jgi:hypothetical protein
MYDGWFDVTDGAMITTDRVGPAEMVANSQDIEDGFIGPVPQMHHWSDVAFLEWQNQAQKNGQDVKNIKTFVSRKVANEYAQQIMYQVLYSLGLSGKPWQTFDEAQVISMDTEEGKALLASPNARGYAQFFLTHKPQLGLKRITGVKMFGDDNPSTDLNPDFARAGFSRPSQNGIPSDLGHLAFFAEDVPAEDNSDNNGGGDAGGAPSA